MKKGLVGPVTPNHILDNKFIYFFFSTLPRQRETPYVSHSCPYQSGESKLSLTFSSQEEKKLLTKIYSK